MCRRKWQKTNKRPIYLYPLFYQSVPCVPWIWGNIAISKSYYQADSRGQFPMRPPQKSLPDLKEVCGRGNGNHQGQGRRQVDPDRAGRAGNLHGARLLPFPLGLGGLVPGGLGGIP